MTSRRELLIALGTGVLAAPLACFAQQGDKVWRIGALSQNSRAASMTPGFAGFLSRMRELGYIEGKNVSTEWRFADSDVEQLPRLAIELARLKVDVIVTAGTPAVRAAQKATKTIPIVMINAGDPVGSGFVASLARPGGNITGLSNVAVDITPKLVEILSAVVPKLSRAALLVNPTNASHPSVIKGIASAGRSVGLQILRIDAQTTEEIEAAFSRMRLENVAAAIIPADPLFNTSARRIAKAAATIRLPSISSYLGYADAGGLASYGQDLREQGLRAAVYVDKIFRGAKPGDLPIEQPTKLELIINRRTAKAMDVTISQEVLLRADRLIE